MFREKNNKISGKDVFFILCQQENATGRMKGKPKNHKKERVQQGIKDLKKHVF